MNELPSVPDGAALFPEASPRFGVTGDNLISCSPAPNTPERIAERRAYAAKRLDDARAFTTTTSARFKGRVVRLGVKKSRRRKLWREVSKWQSCVDRMKNGDVGMRAEWAMQWEEILASFKKACLTFLDFKDTDGNAFFPPKEEAPMVFPVGSPYPDLIEKSRKEQ